MHGPMDHERLCKLNGIYSEELKYVPDEPTMIQLDGWHDKTDPTKQHSLQRS
jgi:hypothetical protein